MTQTADRWKLDETNGIVWDVAADARLPHQDHIEMSGRTLSLIARYGADESGHLTLSRQVIWPMLRTLDNPKKHRAYLSRTYGENAAPRLFVGEEMWRAPLSRVRLRGVLELEHADFKGVRVARTLFPATRQAVCIERWSVRNTTPHPVRVRVEARDAEEITEPGVYGRYRIQTRCDAPPETEIAPGGALRFGLSFGAGLADAPTPNVDAEVELRARLSFVDGLNARLQLETPDAVLNRAFEMGKLRATESVFETKLGLVHSPGGGRYYGGVWANDQAEYSGPFFPFLGEPAADEAALNAYRIFARAMTPDYKFLPSSFEVEGDVVYRRFDRGDAAMIAQGASRFALARGDRAIALELWPAIVWCLEYCRRRTNEAGVVESESDELESRFSTGRANLSTSSLAYGALRGASDLARALGKPDAARDYDQRADALRLAIERYFGARVEGFKTYRYHEGNEVLRAWICLPLVMGIDERQEGTIAALFSPRLWTPDGLATEAGGRKFWDRSTLFALRGAFTVGETETALSHLSAYTRRRLLGEHVPYAVEASPEGGQAHLSAESALLCRVVTEGLFGITPAGFDRFDCTPRLPAAWPAMRLQNIRAFGQTFDLDVARHGGQIELTARIGGRPVFHAARAAGERFSVALAASQPPRRSSIN